MSSLTRVSSVGGAVSSDVFGTQAFGRVIVIWDYSALDNLLHQPTGAVGRDLQARADRVKWAAKTQAGLKTGALKFSIHTDWSRTRTGQKIAIGSPLTYALAHHEGTKPHIIFAKSEGMLKFRGRGGVKVYTRSVVHPGSRPNRYLTDNLYLAIVSSNLPAVP